MFLKSGVDYYLYVAEDVEVITMKKNKITSPAIKFKLLSYPDLFKIDLMRNSNHTEAEILEEICKKSIIGFLEYPDEEIDYAYCPAGVIETLGTKIYSNSQQVAQDPEKTFETMFSSISILERITLVVAHYTNNTYEYCQSLPIDELYKRYAICSAAFQATPIVFEKEESKVGG